MTRTEARHSRPLPKPVMRTLPDGSREWRVGVVLHRDDGPAIERPDGSREWWWRGERHRPDGPAAEGADGARSWWVHGNPHREDGPAFEYADGTREWWRDGHIHRLDGPAVERPDGTVEWWFEGQRVSEQEHRALARRRSRRRGPMRLWLLAPHALVLQRKRNPWRPPHDKVFAAVVRARTEREARRLVQNHAGREGLGIYLALGMEEEEAATTVWLDAQLTRCVELRAVGRPAVIVVDREQA